MIKVSAPGKVHLLGEHTVVYGKPALLSAINKRVTVTIGKADQNYHLLRQAVDKLIKKKFKVNKIPNYAIESEIPVGSGLGFSAAGSATIITALLTHFKIKWGLNLINQLTFEAEKVFHENPSGGDNTTVIYGDLIIFQKGVISPTKSKIKKFILINSGKPSESTKQMIEIAKPKIKSILDSQEGLTKQLVIALRDSLEKDLLDIFQKAEKNLEKIGVVGKIAKKIIKDIESLGGAGKISGAGGVKTGSGMLLAYHQNPQILLKYAKQNNLEAFIIKLGEEGLRQE